MKKIISILAMIVVLTMVVSAFSLAESNVWDRYDLGGRTVTFTRTLLPGSDVGIFDEGRGAAWKEQVEEKFNVNIQFVDNYPTINFEYADTVLAGDPYVDVHNLRMPEFLWLMYPEGIFFPLDQIVEDSYWERLPEEYNNPDFYQVAGNTVGFRGAQPEVGSPELPLPAQVVFWNKDLFEREGLPNLYELYESGEWTWDKMKEIAVAATRDTDGDGEFDQWGLDSRLGHYQTNWLELLTLSKSNNASLAREIDGRATFTFDEIEAIDTMEYWLELIDLEVFSPQGFHMAEYFTGGDVAMRLAPLYQIWDGHTGPQFAEMQDDFGIVPYPKGPAADEHVAPILEMGMAFIPITEPDPVEVMEVYTALHQLTSDYTDFDIWREELYDDLAMHVRDRESIEIVRWLSNNNARPLKYWFNLWQFVGVSGVLLDVVSGEMSPSAAVEAVKPMAQEYLDEAINRF